MGQFAKTLTSYVAFTRPFSLWSRVKLVGARVLVRIGVRPVERPLWVKPRSFGAAVAVRPYYVDLVAAEEIFEERVYETVLEFLPARLTIVDLGAQAGLAAQYLARGREVTELVAAEPDADLNHTLHANLAAICPRARIHLAAVWDHESGVVNEGDAYYEVRAAAANELADVPSVTAARILRDVADERVGLLKIDIEGAEVAALRDAASWLHRVDCMAIEFHGASREESDFDHLMAQSGLTVVVDGDHTVVAVRQTGEPG